MPMINGGLEVIIINQVFISCICRMRKFGFAAMMTLPMALIGMEMEMQDLARWRF